MKIYIFIQTTELTVCTVCICISTCESFVVTFFFLIHFVNLQFVRNQNVNREMAESVEQIV